MELPAPAAFYKKKEMVTKIGNKQIYHYLCMPHPGQKSS